MSSVAASVFMSAEAVASAVSDVSIMSSAAASVFMSAEAVAVEGVGGSSVRASRHPASSRAARIAAARVAAAGLRVRRVCFGLSDAAVMRPPFSVFDTTAPASGLFLPPPRRLYNPDNPAGTMKGLR